MHKKKFNLSNINTGLIALTLVLIAGGFYFYGKNCSPVSETPVTTPPVIESPTGEQPPVGNNGPTGEFVSAPSADGKTFRVNTSGSGPRLIEGFIDPFEANVGDNQLFSIFVIDSNITESVAVTVKTDNAEATYPLKLASGTRAEGHWQGNWTVTDTTAENFRIVITAVGGQGTSSVEWTLR